MAEKKKTKPSTENMHTQKEEDEQVKELKRARKTMEKAEKAIEEVNAAWEEYVAANDAWGTVDRQLTFFHNMIVDRYFHGNTGNPEFILQRANNHLLAILNDINCLGDMLRENGQSAAKKVEKALKKYIKLSTNRFVKEIGLKDVSGKKSLEKKKLRDYTMPNGIAFHDFTFGLEQDVLDNYTFANISLEQFRHWIMFGYPEDSAYGTFALSARDISKTVSDYMTRFDDSTLLKLVSELNYQQKKAICAFLLSSATESNLITTFNSLPITQEAIQRIFAAIKSSIHANVIDGYIDTKTRIAARSILQKDESLWIKYQNLPFINDPTDTEYRKMIGSLFLSHDVLDELVEYSAIVIVETLGELHGLDAKLLDEWKPISEKLYALFGTLTEHTRENGHDMQVYLISGKETLMLVPEFSLHAVPVMSGLKTVIAKLFMNHLIDAMGDDYPEGLKRSNLENCVGVAMEKREIDEELLLENLQLIGNPEWNC